jgi:membrane-associated phospholipid phosphatase
MRGRAFVFGGILVAAIGARGRAQSVVAMVGSDLRNAVGDIVGVWVSPIHSGGRDWLTAGGLLAGTAALSVWDDDVDRYMAAHQHNAVWSPLKELREGGAAFAGTNIAPVVGAAYIVGLATQSRSIRDGVFGCVAAYASESVVRTQVLYRLVERERPDSSRYHVITAPPAIQGDQYHFAFGTGTWGMQATPAGHVANAAACASFLSHRFKLGFVRPVVYLVVAGVGVGRMVDRRHWTSDTVLGTIFGYAIGKEVAQRSRERIDREQHATRPDSGGNDQRLSPPDGVTQPARAQSPFSRALTGLYLGTVPGGIGAGWRATF